MAFAFNRQQNNNQPQQSNDSWKAQGFINLYLPTKDGGKRKLGVIALHEAKESEKNLLAWLKEDPARVEQIMAKLQMDFRTAEPTEGAQFDL